MIVETTRNSVFKFSKEPPRRFLKSGSSFGKQFYSGGWTVLVIKVFIHKIARNKRRTALAVDNMTSLFEDNTTTRNKSDDNKPELALKIDLIVRFPSRGRWFCLPASPQIETFPTAVKTTVWKGNVRYWIHKINNNHTSYNL